MNLKKVIGALLFINFLQIILVVMICISTGNKFQQEVNLSLYLIVGLALINSLATVGGIYYASKLKSIHLLESMKNLEQFNTTLRAQRHDYLNHLQVIYGLMELEEYEEARKYLEPVFKEVIKVSKALKTAQPAVNALLQAKLEMAEKNKVDMYLEVKSNLKELKLEPWELCKVLANLIDNGITALLKKEVPRSLYLEIGEDISNYMFVVRNNGQAIPKEQISHIFEPGFTTKGEEGHGMGLYIVNKIVVEAGGTIKVQSDKERTSFEIHLPKMTL